MQDEGNGNEQSGWKPLEYVSPWASAPAGDGGEGNHDTIAFGAGEPEGAGEPTRVNPQPAPDQSGFGGYRQPLGQAPTGNGTEQPGSGAGGAGYGAAQGGYPAPAGYGGAQGGAYGGPQGGGGYGAPQGGGYGSPQGGWGYGAPQGGGPGYGGAGYGGPGYGGPGYPGPGYGGYGTPDMPGYDPGRRGGLGRFLIYAAVAVLAAGAGAGAAVALNHSANTTPSISSQDIPQPGSGSGGGNTAPSGGTLNQQALEAKVDPGIVDITSTLKYQSETAEGTGIILSAKDGVILTNNHVIDGATSIRATLVQSGKTYTARVLGYDATDDVALLKLDNATGLSQVSVGNSNAVKLDDPVLALGNAQGKMGTPSAAAGIVNALHRTINASDSGSAAFTETLHNMIQTNAQIQEGDSGGPLVNAAGEVIGMDTAANTSSSDQFGGQPASTTGFAIPINNALLIAKQIANGKATNTVHIGLAGFMGVEVSDINKGCEGTPGFGGGGFGGGGGGTGGGAGGYTPPVSSGALVCAAIPGTPAAASGLAAGDIITSADGHAVSNSTGLTTVTNTTHPGDKLTVTYVDANGARHTTSFSLLEEAK